MILSTESEKKFNSEITGGKAYNLFFIQNYGLNVPQFVVITDDFSNSVNFSNVKMLLGLQEGEKIILRSSAQKEDGVETSYAGIFESKVIDFHEKYFYAGLNYLQECAQSIKVEKYLEKNHISDSPKLSIIVQKYITFTSSGVVFSSNPSNPEKGFLINSNFGQPNGVVDGDECDRIQVSYQNKITSYATASKNSKKSLDLSQIKTLISNVARIRNLYNENIDIEFGFLNSELFILQVRPITSFAKESEFYLDSSNIRENFPNKVLPLTYSILQEVYGQTYYNLVKYSGRDDSFLYMYKDLFDNMLSEYNGEVFYNIGNWYKMSGLLPGSESNSKGLKNMITGDVLPISYETENISLIFKIKYYLLVVYKFLKFKRTNKFYQYTANVILSNLGSLNFKKFSLNSIYIIWIKISGSLLRKSYITTENDFLLMYFVEKLRTKIKNEEKFASIIQQILSTRKTSSLQIQKLNNIKNYIQNDVYLQKEINNLDSLEQIISVSPKYLNLRQLIQEYIIHYKGRFSEELNLSVTDKSAKNIQDVLKLINFTREDSPDVDVEFIELSRINQFYARQISIFAKNREDNRLIRAKLFGLLRNIFDSVAIKLVAIKFLEKPEDIHYLTYKEVWDFINLNSVNSSLKDIVEVRKKMYSTDESIGIISGSGTISDFYNKKMKSVDKDFVTSEHNQLKGTACSQGVVRGKITVLTSFPENLEQYEILVVRRTDPGWITIFGNIKGIIIEYGGVLSHAAIIARELGIPAVIGVLNATEIFQNDQIVEINGATGEIKIIQ